MQKRPGPAAISLLVAALVLGGCGSNDREPASPASPSAVPVSSTGDHASRDYDDCEDLAFDVEPMQEFVSGYIVADGELGANCWGEEDEVMVDVWQQLVALTPPSRLKDLTLFAGFVYAAPGREGPSLAFVNPLDGVGTRFQMSVNLVAFEEDRDEAMLTMAHEMSHVFTATPDQIDRRVYSSQCATYYNGEGCFLPGSLMADWTKRFWKPEDLAHIGSDRDATIAEGVARCRVDPSFLGSYAASTPEEDFAESFAAFVFQAGPATDEVQSKLHWFAGHPELVEFQTRAMNAKMSPIDGDFERCGP